MSKLTDDLADRLYDNNEAQYRLLKIAYDIQEDDLKFDKNILELDYETYIRQDQRENLTDMICDTRMDLYNLERHIEYMHETLNGIEKVLADNIKKMKRGRMEFVYMPADKDILYRETFEYYTEDEHQELKLKLEKRLQEFKIARIFDKPEAKD